MSSEILIEALRDPARYPHPADRIELIETHISWLLLAGEFVYKIKKPVDFGFVDFSSLEKRRHYCFEELRLNRRFAPELYLEVAPLCGTETDPRWGGEGEPFEYAVKMKRFADEARLDRALARGEITLADCDRLAESIAAGHAIAEAATVESEYGWPERIQKQTLDTLQIARRALPESFSRRIDELRDWCDSAIGPLIPLMRRRREQGFVRECHGDLHLENMVSLDGRIVLFDCLEFNPRLRWIDVLSDVAFVVVDLADRGRPAYAHRLLNRYLEITGDYAGLPLLPYYQVYRAIVRGAVAGMRYEQSNSESPAERDALLQKAEVYLRLAQDYARTPRAGLLITYGCSGSGKSTLTQALVERLGAIRMRSDVVRRRLDAADMDRETRYGADRRRRVYESMLATTHAILSAGRIAIADATFLSRRERAEFQELGERLSVPFAILSFDLPAAELRARMLRRHPDDPSEATLEVLERQLAEREKLDDRERAFAVSVPPHLLEGAELDCFVDELSGRLANSLD